MYPSSGLQTALNAMREMSISDGKAFHQFVPLVSDSTTIGEYAAPIIDPANTNVLNDFIGLLEKVIYTSVYSKTFNSPLAQLEGERMPLGQFIEDVYVNPAQGRAFDVNDFAGLLQKYESQTAVAYYHINADRQYCATVTRAKIRNAFTSWSNLEAFITGIVNSLYNGCYLTRYAATKALPTAAFHQGALKYTVITNPTDKATAEALVQKIRADYNKMQIPSTKFNAWQDVKGEGAFALKTWSNPEDLVLLISADVEALVSTTVLAAAFNLSEADYLARKITIDDFNVYADDGSVEVDGSMIKAVLVDRSWFKIKTVDFEMEEFRNPNNRTIQFYLNDVRMENWSLFSNGMAYVTSEPSPSGSDSE